MQAKIINKDSFEWSLDSVAEARKHLKKGAGECYDIVDNLFEVNNFDAAPVRVRVFDDRYLVECSRCHGASVIFLSGSDIKNDADPCPHCKGAGVVPGQM